MYDYKLDYEEGRKCEQAFRGWLNKRYPHLKTWIAPDDKAETYDIRLYGNECSVRFEIKLDRYIKNTGNLLVEMETITPKGVRKNGWFRTCSADIIVYFKDEFNFIAFDWKDVRDNFYTSPQWWYVKEIKQSNGDITVNFLTPNWRANIKYYGGDVRE